MGISKKLLTAAVSIAVSCTSMAAAVSGTVGTLSSSAAEYSLSDIYDNIIQEESKGETEETPFKVFDIYDAFVGGTSTVVPTTSTTTTTTTVSATENTTTADTTTTRTASSQLTLTTTTTTTAPPVNEWKESWGVDVSRYQSTIDWKRAKAAGVDFAIIQAGYGRYASQKDSCFDMNVVNAQAAGVDCGVYWYSYATTPQDALLEAEACYEVIKKYDFTYPLYYDVEESSQQRLSAATVSAIVDTFCSAMEQKGYFVGVYSYAYFLESKVYKNVLDKYDVWVAQYASSPSAYSGTYGMWQYSSSGWIDGIPTNVDVNHAYRNYPYLISLANGSSSGGTTTTTTPVATGAKKGIDVSSVQGEIDWNAVRSSGMQFAVVRAGYSDGDGVRAADDKFNDNVQGAADNGIPRGAYWHTAATSVEDILKDAETFYSIISPYKLEYPLYLDISDPAILDAGLTSEEITDMIGAFCSYFEAKGYYIGVTSYEYFLNTYVDASVFEDYDVWIASHGVGKPEFSSKYGIWQFSASGTVSGINGVVDMDYCYRDYPSIMSAYHLNGF
ncbi:MAG: glycoside hydrolase family 25 protein [Ruminococcus sp.]|nr:glycoside hydrolase family 25 protein [Ruminococcus sp.]